ncbi:hypothetical protein [Corynebacterium pelargi]|uniref:Uncharacterized protein n=1 Tax=Corynebacterium pelargi TaxID=1471400 RepID=A0A410WAU1_9CORY|nr:hypothetical protein [Corynebacterium pelargi]QAU53054.1 hypothetical protein CPELA_08995 [Corynebacterium pelargi]GGG75177.1 hypothetical protein GCM10007338_10860 [Corynebacterium pelargi]
MSETKKDASQRLQEAANAVTNFWNDGFLNGKPFEAFLHGNGEFDQGELEPDTFIHPKDVAFLKDEADPEGKRLATLRSWVNGYEGNKLKEFQADDAKALPLYPAVPQPFMGDLSAARLLVVTMNPGFHEYSDWVMGRPFSALPWKTRGKLHYCIGDLYGFNPSDTADEKSERVRKRAREQWKQEQEKLLRHIRGEEVLVPWSMDGRSPDFAFCPPLNCHGDSASLWGGEELFPQDPEEWPMGKHNWHTTYFGAPDAKTYLRSLFPEKERNISTSDLVAQVELHPYASKTGADLKKLLHSEDFELNVADQNADFGRFLPSQRPILEYVRTFMGTAEERNAIVVFRGSLFGDNGVKWLDSTIKSSASAKARCFYRSGQGFRLNISKDLKNRATDKPVQKSDLQELLKTHST